MTWVRALDDRGQSLGHVPTGVFSSSGMNQAGTHLKQARYGKARLRTEMCESIAARVAALGSMSRVARLQIVDAWYRPEKVFGPARDERSERERVLVTCRVHRTTRS